MSLPNHLHVGLIVYRYNGCIDEPQWHEYGIVTDHKKGWFTIEMKYSYTNNTTTTIDRKFKTRWYPNRNPLLAGYYKSTKNKESTYFDIAMNYSGIPEHILEKLNTN